ALERIDGRLSDWFVDEHGRRVAPHRLWLSAHLDAGLDIAARYQVRQLPSRQVHIRLLPKVTVGAETLRRIEESYRRLLGVPVDVELVDRLDDERSHKFRTIMAVSDA